MRRLQQSSVNFGCDEALKLPLCLGFLHPPFWEIFDSELYSSSICDCGGTL